MARVERELRKRGATDAGPARAFRLGAGLAWPDGHEELFEGRVFGALVWPPRGTKGFGYDPMFQPDGHERTFGEMTSDEKHGLPAAAEACRTGRAAFAALARACLARGGPTRRTVTDADQGG